MFQYFNLVSMCLSILQLGTPIVAPWLPISKGIGHNHSFLQQWILIVGIATCPFLSAFRLFVRFFGISHSLSNCLAPDIFRWISVNLTYFPNNSKSWQIKNISNLTTSSHAIHHIQSHKKNMSSPSDHWETPGHSAGHWAISAICAACGATLNS